MCNRGRVFVCVRERVREEERERERERMCVLLQNGFRKENGVRAQKKKQFNMTRNVQISSSLICKFQA